MPILIDIFPARDDNYGYLVHDVATGKTAAIDAPDAKAITDAAARRGWTVSEVFITHHHIDHVEAIADLKRDLGVKVTGPAEEADKIEGLDVLVAEGDTVALGDSSFEVFHTPGHTLGHIVYFEPEGRHLFSADALFSLGVGRMFEGQPAPMWAGLQTLMALPDDTLVYCGHEYTESNAAFALSVDPKNAALNLRAAEVKRMRAEGRPTIPVSLQMEKATNPFLRAEEPALAEAVGLAPGADPAEVFGRLRKGKDNFKG